MAGRYYQSIRNNFRPSSLVPKPYGWTGMPTYNRFDVPVNLIDQQTNGLTHEGISQVLAYEWLESEGMGSDRNLSNPPFTSGASGRIPPMLREGSSGEIGTAAVPRILRGFIRRANYEVGDPLSRARLYFMYNPEAITREYVSYLDQAALDPFNTVFNSGNLVAPPSYMNFRFDLFFDRQTETVDPNYPGVFVDYQFFDLVVRNVIPNDPNQSSNQLPDNGVMMVNPRDITVIFSPQMTVQGRPVNAQVSFEKFTHRMTPIRMRISLEMRVMYFGPLRDQSEYRMRQSEFISEVSVPTEEEYTFDLTFTNVVMFGNDDQEDMVSGPNGSVSQPPVISPSGSGRADSRGWGPGWPTNRSSDMVAINVTGTTFPGGVHKDIAVLTSRLVAETKARGYVIGSGGNPSYGCWGYVNKSINNRGQSPSNHSWGLAVDINAPSNGLGSTGNMPGWMVDLWRQYGFNWGGAWSGSSKDPMHYEYLGTPATAAQHRAAAQANGIGRSVYG